MSIDIATGNSLTRGQESAALVQIAKQTGIPDVTEAVKAFLRGDFELSSARFLEEVWTDGHDWSVTKKISILIQDSADNDTYKSVDPRIPELFIDPGCGSNHILNCNPGKPFLFAQLRRNGARNADIIKEIGERCAFIKLAELFAVVDSQRYGEEHGLLTDGHINVCYCRDRHAIVRPLELSFHGGWHLTLGDFDGDSHYEGRVRFFWRSA